VSGSFVLGRGHVRESDIFYCLPAPAVLRCAAFAVFHADICRDAMAPASIDVVEGAVRDNAAIATTVTYAVWRNMLSGANRRAVRCYAPNSHAALS